jgi:hypothetical protein
MNKKLLLSIVGIDLLISFPRTGSGQWVQTDIPGDGIIADLAVSDSTIFAGTVNNGVFLSTNIGTSWTAVNSGLPNTVVQSFAVSGSTIFAGTAGSGIFLSTNNGTDWISANAGITFSGIYSLIASGDNIFAGTNGGGVFLSINNGTSWIAVNSGLENTFIPSLAVSGNRIFAGTWRGIFLSTNNGTDWTSANAGLPPWSGNNDVSALTVSGGNIFAGIDSGGVFLSTNNGADWTAVNSGLMHTKGYHWTFAVSGGNIFAGTDTGGVFLSTNNGANWSSVGSGFPDINVVSLAVASNHIFAGTSGAGVWRRSLSEMVPVFRENQKSVPPQNRLGIRASDYSHSLITLRCGMKSRAAVSFEVYTLSGKKIASLQQSSREPGVYSAILNGATIPDGTFICRFKAGNYQESRYLPIVK